MKARRVLRESNETLKEGYGFSNQREDCIKFETDNVIELVKEHQLVETSSSWNREKFQTIINEAIQEREEISAIVFPRVDRFARNLEAAGYYLGLLRQNGLTVMFAQEDLVVDNEASVMTVLMFFIHSFKADQDGKQIKHNALGGRDKLATEACEIPNGMVMWPFDYMAKRVYGQMSTGKPTINGGRTGWVKQWAEWIVNERLGLAQVCTRTNEAGIVTRRGGRFWPKAIRDILRSKQLTGIFEWKGAVYLTDDNLRILSDETFDALQKRLDENRDRSFYNAVKHDYPPLPKMVFCGYHQNQIMYGKPIRSTTWYYCPQCKKEGHPNQIRSKVLWEQYRHEIEHKLLEEERLIPALREQFDNNDTIDRLEQDIKAKTKEIQRCDDTKDAAFHLGMSIRNYSQEKVQNQIDRADEKLRHLNAERLELERVLRTIREQKFNEEGIRRLCRIVAKNFDDLTKKQWEMLNKMMNLKITVYSKDLVTVNVALPPVRDSEIEFSRL